MAYVPPVSASMLRAVKRIGPPFGYRFLTDRLRSAISWKHKGESSPSHLSTLAVKFRKFRHVLGQVSTMHPGFKPPPPMLLAWIVFTLSASSCTLHEHRISHEWPSSLQEGRACAVDFAESVFVRTLT
jgi:hypothetical protein